MQGVRRCGRGKGGEGGEEDEEGEEGEESEGGREGLGILFGNGFRFKVYGLERQKRRGGGSGRGWRLEGVRRCGRGWGENGFRVIRV